MHTIFFLIPLCCKRDSVVSTRLFPIIYCTFPTELINHVQAPLLAICPCIKGCTVSDL